MDALDVMEVSILDNECKGQREDHNRDTAVFTWVSFTSIYLLVLVNDLCPTAFWMTLMGTFALWSSVMNLRLV